MSEKSEKKLLSANIPVIAIAFILAFAIPDPVNVDNFMSHVSGIALGFGIAWLLKFLGDWKKLKTQKSEV